MVRKKIDNRIRTLVEDGVARQHRTMFVIVGEKAKDQVMFLHHILLKSTVRTQPNILWCYKKDLGFSTHRMKRMKMVQKKSKLGQVNVDLDDPFQQFIHSSKIRYCYYKETHNILGNTYDMCVIQDFEVITPNILARTLETVQGGGIIVFLLESLKSLKQLYTMNMDVHQRLRTEAHQDVVCRFNERFLLSLANCKRCLVIDDRLQVLPISSSNLTIAPAEKTTIDTSELDSLKRSLQDEQPVGAIVNCCKTVDQANAIIKFIEAISEKTLRSTISLTAARGRGKSAALGLSIAAAIAYGYSNIFITSPSPENLTTAFEFISKGLIALKYQEHTDYQLLKSSNADYNQATIRVDIFRDHKQTVQYINPADAKEKLGMAELLVIDEAAAIPLPYVKDMLGPYLIFMASTINGYEGTGRSLTLKLLQQLRTQAKSSSKISKDSVRRNLKELSLEEPIRYRAGDSVEKWLCELLCLDATTGIPSTPTLYPKEEDCQLYYINRDTLFSYHKASEMFLQRMMALCVSSHYKNSPDDLQMMSDGPAHHLFCLLGPVDSSKTTLPEILVVIQMCLEGQLRKSTVSDGLAKREKRAAGDLIPWTIGQQFQDEDFPSLCGARIVRIATHPDYQNRGYGKRAIKLLKKYYRKSFIRDENDLDDDEMKIDTITEDEDVDLLQETIEPKSSLPPLFLKLSERRPEHLDYIGVSFGVSEPLMRFWTKKAGFVPVYIRQTSNDITGEQSCIMLSKLGAKTSDWLEAYWKDFRRRFVMLLQSSFRDYSIHLAWNILSNQTIQLQRETLPREKMLVYFTTEDIQRLEMFKNNMCDYTMILDLMFPLAKLYFFNYMGDLNLSVLQSTILLGMGLQYKTVDQIVEELNRMEDKQNLTQADLKEKQELTRADFFKVFKRLIRESVEYLKKVL
ncbi:hypothetical protein TKK_0009737 [Trichogramma kaykai]|uniref:RNA cytidine acetyltransferase n=1 Tax=Trichogramma kaykai TaxID=54128 RepID=A0ABD2X065_9HYME